MNYPMYNTYPYSPIPQAPQPYGQRFPSLMAQNPVPARFNPYPMNPVPTIGTHGQPNTYDNIIRSAAETLAAFTNPLEMGTMTKTRPMTRYGQSHSNRRSTGNNSTNSNASRMYYCETCRIACGGHATYQAHLNGSKHKKKELTAQTNPTTSTNPFRCELCDISCTNSDAYKAHVEGSKHEKAMKLYKRLGKTIPPVELTENSPNVDVSNNVEQEKIPPPVENGPKPIGEEYIETTFDDNKKPLIFHCKLCDCKFNDANAKDAHLKGKRHRISFRKKVDPNFQVETNNKTNNAKPRPIEKIEPAPLRPTNNVQTSEIEENGKFLMNLLEEIMPNENFLKTVDELIGAVESALKSSSEKLRSISNSSENLLGVSRTGPLGKNLLIKSDRSFEIVVPCDGWPKRKLFDDLSENLLMNFEESWQKRVEVRKVDDNERIEVEAATEEGLMSVSIRLTSTSVQQIEDNDMKSDEPLLTRQSCLDGLNAMQSVRWFQNQIATKQNGASLIRIFRYKTKISSLFRAFPVQSIEVFLEQALLGLGSISNAFRRLLELLSSGFVLKNGPGLKSIFHNDSNLDVFQQLTEQQRNDITTEAQIGLRLFAFGQLSRWFDEENANDSQSNSTKRSFFDDDEQNSTKRFCVGK